MERRIERRKIEKNTHSQNLNGGKVNVKMVKKYKMRLGKLEEDMISFLKRNTSEGEWVSYSQDSITKKVTRRKENGKKITSEKICKSV